MDRDTPMIINKIINAFDRKINGVSIFTDEVKAEYFKGLQDIFREYYEGTYEPKMSRRSSYISYLADLYITYGKSNYRSKAKTYKEFIMAGMSNRYRY